MADLDDDIGTGDAGAATFVPAQCSSLRKGGHVMIKDRPCKITDMSTSKTGKHGHAKVHLVANDIFTGKKLEDICPSTHNMNVPIVKRTELQLIDLEDGYCHLMDDGGNIRTDLQLPEDDVGSEILDKFAGGEGEQDLALTILSACGEEKIIGYKTIT